MPIKTSVKFIFAILVCLSLFISLPANAAYLECTETDFQWVGNNNPYARGTTELWDYQYFGSSSKSLKQSSFNVCDASGITLTEYYCTYTHAGSDKI